MCDRLAGGQLADTIATLRSQGLSWEAVNARLFADFGIEVTHQTIRIWGRELGTDAEAVA